MVLLIVLVAIALLSLAAYTFCDLMITQQEGAALAGQRAQTRQLAQSGVEWIRAVVMTPGVHPDTFYFDPDRFQGVLVQDDPDPQWRGRFSILAPGLGREGQLEGLRWGLENESARLNLGLLAESDQLDAGQQRTSLMQLPGMNESLADAILDWIDADDTPREYGAEAEYYAVLHPPYEPKNAPLESIDELLRVRGVVPELLFGRDADQNGMIDAYEISRPATTSGALGPMVDYGWAAYLTLTSAERNVNARGLPRIDVNGDDLEALYEQLVAVMEPDWATFIIAYRQNGPQQNGSPQDGQQPGQQPSGAPGGSPDSQSPGDSGSNGVSASFSFQAAGQGGTVTFGAGSPGNAGPGAPGGTATGEPVNGRQVDLTQPGGHRIEQLLDLIGAKVQVTFPGAPQPTLLESPFVEDLEAMREYLPLLVDELTTVSEPVVRGRVHINQAPLPVLMAVPHMTPEAAQRIVEVRGGDPSAVSAVRQVPTWPLTEGIVTLEEMKKLLPFLTTRGDVYRAQVVGFFDASGPFTRVEVVVDATGPLARVLSWKELNHLGRGYSLEVLGALQR